MFLVDRCFDKPTEKRTMGQNFVSEIDVFFFKRVSLSVMLFEEMKVCQTDLIRLLVEVSSEACSEREAESRR